ACSPLFAWSSRNRSGGELGDPPDPEPALVSASEGSVNSEAAVVPNLQHRFEKPCAQPSEPPFPIAWGAGLDKVRLTKRGRYRCSCWLGGHPGVGRTRAKRNSRG